MNEEQLADRDAERNFALNVRRRREALGWSQSELARRMADEGWETYNQMTVSRTEKEERSVRLGEARALARVLGQSVEEMTRPTGEALYLDNVRQWNTRIGATIAALEGAALAFEHEREGLPAAVEQLKGEFVQTDWQDDHVKYVAEDELRFLASHLGLSAAQIVDRVVRSNASITGATFTFLGAGEDDGE